eukprot:CAMPEP_0116127188 /NCGR_PEP_ID=MMETSP0329-20121206/6713_1 /TAXON_ID=697910 /ORGANISM="Pseudo-nitzschia arenysensis, Strain B593" /LENGTH=504 /DNA_ID=CAMNT_0003621283 /DNA_START=113 /DNA_END=1627 /DNA_ORIENTATION=-
MSSVEVPEAQPAESRAESPSDPPGRNCMSFEKNPQARGVNYNGIARGAVSMSNVYLGNALILLACKAAGGANEEGTMCVKRDVEIYGMRPAALLSNIAIASALLSAFMMPPVGAIVDFTPDRKKWGIIMAVLLAVISAIQIGTVENTWFAMAILQAIVFAVYQLELTILYAYFPEIGREVGQGLMNRFTTSWYANQFTSQASVNLIIILCSIFFKLGTVKTSMVSQSITAAFCAVFMTACWRYLPEKEPKHKLPKGNSLVMAGFKQNVYMAKKIWTNYKMGLRWFLLSTIFAEAAASAVGSTAVIFLSLHIQLTAFQIGIFFEVSLIGVIIGTKVGGIVTKLTNPKISFMISELGFGLAIVIGCWLVEYAPKKELTYIWGFSIGIFLGWFYPLEVHVLSFIVPINVETELAGFFNWSSQIMGWLPPFAFTVVVQRGISLPWALTVVAIHFIPAILFLAMCGSWEEIVKEGQTVEVDFYEAYDDQVQQQNDVEAKKDTTEAEKSD